LKASRLRVDTRGRRTADLCAEVDVFWATYAGYSPAKFIRDHGSRIPLVHLKDKRELGAGPVDFTQVFAATDSVGAVEWFIIEQEEYTHAPWFRPPLP